MRCPVCRADNEAGAAVCRRCKADLAPLAALESSRAAALHRAARAAARGCADLVLREAQEAQLLRPGPDALRWLAVGHLLRRDFARALGCYRRAAGDQIGKMV
jgi:hypothetical protein